MKDTCGCINICTGSVKHCAHNVMLNALARLDGIYLKKILLKDIPQTIIPKVAQTERANE